MKMDKNLSNLLAIFGRVSDTYTFISLAFSNNVEWYPGQTFSSSAISVTDGSAAVFLIVFNNIICLRNINFFILFLIAHFFRIKTLCICSACVPLSH